MRIKDNGLITLTKQEDDLLIDLIANTGVEIWNGTCTKRINAGSDTNLQVCDYDNPLRGKGFETAQGAINSILRSEQ